MYSVWRVRARVSQTPVSTLGEYECLARKHNAHTKPTVIRNQPLRETETEGINNKSLLLRESSTKMHVTNNVARRRRRRKSGTKVH